MLNPGQFVFVVASIFCAGDMVMADETHLVSSHISTVILAGLPKFDPKQAAGSISAPNMGRKPGGTAETTTSAAPVRLPVFVVTGLKSPPPTDQVLTRKGEEEAAMDEYLGDTRGLDRGVLNRFTLPQLWRKIPVLGVLPFVGTELQISNQERAMQISERAKMAYWKELISIGQPRGDPAVKKEQRDIDQARSHVELPQER